MEPLAEGKGGGACLCVPLGDRRPLRPEEGGGKTAGSKRSGPTFWPMPTGWCRPPGVG